MFSQLAKRSPYVVVSGYLRGFFATVDIFREARSGLAEEMIKKPKNHHASLRLSLRIVFVFWY